jgi:GNAT superfamily N-acetyltransferase
MNWPSAAETTKLVPLPPSYRFERLRREEIPELITRVAEWHPDITVGAASCYLREDFYAQKVFLDGELELDVAVFLVKRDGEMVALWSFEREIEALTIYGRLLIVSPAHRGSKIAVHLMAGTEPLCRAMGAEFIYAMATLKVPNMQVALERAGYRLLGFTPGYDREVVAPGVVKRVFEALYAKVLVSEENLLRPDPANLTPRTKALFEHLFPLPSNQKMGAGDV